MRFGRGWVRNVRPFAHTFSAVHPLSLAATITDGSDLTPFAAPVMDQGPTSVCVGHAKSDAAVTSFAKAGKPLGFVPSQSGIYTVANAVTRAAQGLDPDTHPLTDEGSMPSDADRGISRYGLHPMGPLAMENGVTRFSDADAKTAIAEPLLVDLEQDARHRIECHAILHGPNVVGDVCAALTEYATNCGFFVDTAFESWNPMHGFVGAPVNPNDPAGGGHDVDIVGFVLAGILAQQGLAALPTRLRATATQATALAAFAAKLTSVDPIYVVKNSWSENWGMGGFFLATKSWLTAPQTGDCSAVLPKGIV